MWKLWIFSVLSVCCFSDGISAPLFADNPLAYGKTTVKSWKTQRDFGIVKQDLDFSCGAASLATLLNGFYGLELTEEEILDKMDKTRERASFDDMRRVLPQYGFEAKGYALSYEKLAQLKMPVVVYLKYRKDNHFSVLRGINGNTVLLADPSLGQVSLSRAQFEKAWNTRNSTLSGKILAVVPQNGKTGNSVFFVKNPQRQTAFAVRQLKTARIE